MFTKHEYPIMEFDDNTAAVINPAEHTEGRFPTDKMIITFFTLWGLNGLCSAAEEGYWTRILK